jgi:hypothetical protein
MSDDPLSGPRLVIDNAPTVPAAISDAEGDATDRAKSGLPRDCPVKPLGMDDDGRFFYLDAIQQLRVLREKDHSRLGLLALFNHRWPILQETWPRVAKDGTVTGWRPERAAEELIAACGRRGPLDIAVRVRGPGAWRDDDGQLVLHCGDRVLIDRQWHRPGEHGGYIYPAAAPVPPPSEAIALGGARGPAQALLDLLKQWNWREPETSPYLLLGWIGAAKLGGALPWRPTLWVTGDLSTGKSTLLGMLSEIFGSGGVHAAVNTSAAGIWQTTRHSSLPITLDESEADSDPRRMRSLIELARAASSGGVIYRGGSEHHPITFTIRCCFLFSSILIPGLLPQDWSRIAVLELDPLDRAPQTLSLDPRKLRALGEALTRRAVDNWPRLTRSFESYRQALAAAGHKARGADQYGMLLACADLLLHDDEAIPSDELEMWARRLRPSKVAVYSDQKRDHQRCIDRIMSAVIDPYRNGSRRTIAQWISDAMDPIEDQPRAANKVLETYGLAVERTDGPAGTAWWLLVANTHAGLAELFSGSHWAPSSGTSAPWVQALRRFAGAAPVAQHRFAGYPARATRLPLREVLDAAPPPEDDE